jgi:hypothetical protein
MTLGDYRKMADLIFPNALDFLDKKIAEQGADQQVEASEEQMMQLLASFPEKKCEVGTP